MSALTVPLVSVEDYFARYQDVKPSFEYVDGVLVQKSMPTIDHGRIQSECLILLRAQGYDALPEITLRLTPTRYLIPDVIAHPSRIEGPYPAHPVHLCIEVLSPDNRFGQILTKCEDYHDWGVPYCWVIDPATRSAWEYHAGHAPRCLGSGPLRAGDLSIPIDSLWAVIGGS